MVGRARELQAQRRIEQGLAEMVGLVRGIIALAHRLEIAAIAEGVESESQLAILRDEGCHYVQGYLLSRPTSAEVFGGMLASGELIQFPGDSKHAVRVD